MDAGGLLKGAPALPAPAPADPLLDQTRRIWVKGDSVYRFNWVILYRTGDIRPQYERRGETVFQTLFAKIPHRGIARILILDVERPFAAIDIPENAEADILYNCRTSDFIHTHRIFTFGYRLPAPNPPAYLHIDPATEPPRVWRSADRIV